MVINVQIMAQAKGRHQPSCADDVSFESNYPCIEITHGKSNGLRDGEDYGGDGGGTNDGSSAPETVHLEEHSSEIGA